MPEKTKNKKKLKQTAILKAAIKTFANKGYEKTKISQIAKKAKVADGTIYLYFKGKEDLLIKSIEFLFNDMLKKMKEKLSKEPDELKKIYKFVQYHIDAFSQNPQIIKFIVLELRKSSEFYENYDNFRPLNLYLGYLNSLCQQAIDAGKIRKVKSETLTRVIFGIIDYSLTEWALRDKKIDLEEFKNEVLEILQFGLKVTK